MAKKKVKPKFPTKAYAVWEGDDNVDEGGYVSLYDRQLSIDEVPPGESKVVGVYELIGFVTVACPKPIPPTVKTSQLRRKP